MRGFFLGRKRFTPWQEVFYFRESVIFVKEEKLDYMSKNEVTVRQSEIFN